MEKIVKAKGSDKVKESIEGGLSDHEGEQEADHTNQPLSKRMKAEEELVEGIAKDPKGQPGSKQAANEDADKENVDRGLVPPSGKVKEIVKAYEAIIENLKTNNTPDKVQFRSTERLKVTNFLRR
jgi:hypothetical protein